MIAPDFAWFIVRTVVEQQIRTSYGALGAALLILVSVLIASPKTPKKEKASKGAKGKKLPKDARGRQTWLLWWVALLLFLLVVQP
ncbi:hypothetical protein OH768_21305 [Streptomyces sp. NBC_01622]|uniref:hypothetical protein n=1 Tax=Streptomyces sp. NBC_01622 TaxID=2975903 RepID=UPI003864AFDA|nr:hypothetical protein OH768_21305 [Streptomyces sp. NBC_01622]